MALLENVALEQFIDDYKNEVFVKDEESVKTKPNNRHSVLMASPSDDFTQPRREGSTTGDGDICSDDFTEKGNPLTNPFSELLVSSEIGFPDGLSDEDLPKLPKLANAMFKDRGAGDRVLSKLWKLAVLNTKRDKEKHKKLEDYARACRDALNYALKLLEEKWDTTNGTCRILTPELDYYGVHSENIRVIPGLPNVGKNCINFEIVTRWKRNADGIRVDRDGLPLLEFVAVKRHSKSYHWSLPELPDRPDEKPFVKTEFYSKKKEAKTSCSPLLRYTADTNRLVLRPHRVS